MAWRGVAMLKEVVNDIRGEQEIRAIRQNERVVRAATGVILQLQDPEPDPSQSRPRQRHNIISEKLRHIPLDLHAVQPRQKPNGLRNNGKPDHHLREFEVLVFLEIGHDGENQGDDEDDSPVPVVGFFHKAHCPVFEHECHAVDGESERYYEFDPAPKVVSQDGEPEKKIVQFISYSL